jgi:hypothetical protein
VIYTTAGSACPTGFTLNSTTAGVGDCTRLYAPNTERRLVGRHQPRSGGTYGR